MGKLQGYLNQIQEARDDFKQPSFVPNSHKKEAIKLLTTLHNRASDFAQYNIKDRSCNGKKPDWKKCMKYQRNVESYWGSLMGTINKILKAYYKG